MQFWTNNNIVMGLYVVMTRRANSVGVLRENFSIYYLSGGTNHYQPTER